MSLKAGGEGLNLQEASHVYLLDPWWNPLSRCKLFREHIESVPHMKSKLYVSSRATQSRIEWMTYRKSRWVFEGAIDSSYARVDTCAEDNDFVDDTASINDFFIIRASTQSFPSPSQSKLARTLLISHVREEYTARRRSLVQRPFNPTWDDAIECALQCPYYIEAFEGHEKFLKILTTNSAASGKDSASKQRRCANLLADVVPSASGSHSENSKRAILRRRFSREILLLSEPTDLRPCLDEIRKDSYRFKAQMQFQTHARVWDPTYFDPKNCDDKLEDLQ